KGCFRTTVCSAVRKIHLFRNLKCQAAASTSHAVASRTVACSRYRSAYSGYSDNLQVANLYLSSLCSLETIVPVRPKEETDNDLLLPCRNGDETAWEALVRRYQRLIYSIPRRSGLDEDQSAEVFQEVFTTLFEKLDRIEEPDRLHAWLVTTARRKTWRF